MPIFLKIEEYNQMIDMYKSAGVRLHEVQTKQRRYFYTISIRDKGKREKKGERVYLSQDPSKEFILPNSSLGLMVRAAKEVHNRYLSEFKAKGKAFADNRKKDFFQIVKNTHYYDIDGNIFPYKWQGAGYQIDISSAYLSAAKNMGLLSEKTYNAFFEYESNKKALKNKKGKKEYTCKVTGNILKHSKKARLISMGILAQDKDITEYDGNKKVRAFREYDPEKANIFFTLALEIGKVMKDIILSCGSAKFAYVDAIFVGEDDKEKARSILERKGYNYSIEPCSIIQNGTCFNVEGFNPETGESKGNKTYYISPLKKPYLLDRIYTNDFAKECIEVYNILKESANNKEKLRSLISRELREHYNISSPNDINSIFIADYIKGTGLKLDDIFKVELSIFEEKKDSFGLQSLAVSKVILKYSEFNSYVSSIDMYPETAEKDLLGEKVYVERHLESRFI